VGQKLNLSWVGLRVARFSVNRKAVKWSVGLNFLRHCQGSTVVFTIGGNVLRLGVVADF
jgi:hypothetical protein